MLKLGSFDEKNDTFQPVAILHSRTSPRDGLCLMVDSKKRMIVPTRDVMLPEGEFFALEPNNLKKGRDVIMVGGKSGSGKSHTARNFAQRYHILWPKRIIYLISYLRHDDTLDALSFLKRLDPANDFKDGPPPLDMFTDTLTIFDDIEGFQRDAPEIHDLLQQTIDMIATTGRHNQSSLLVASHLLTDYKRTRLFLGEAHKFVLFPNGCSMKQMTNLLGLYGGCDTDELRRIRKLPSRWVALCTTFPSLVLYESGCYLLHSDSQHQQQAKTLKRPREEEAASNEGAYEEEEDESGGAGGGGPENGQQQKHQNIQSLHSGASTHK
jgi:hypothetical protein